jgi:branched-chain amino acid transport system substrate-binding protein
MKTLLVTGVAGLVAALAITIPGALAGTTATPGVTSKSVTIGTTMPITGPANFYASIGAGMRAYFSYINARKAKSDGKRGVYGRQIIFKVEDDGYNPVNTLQKTRKLVEQDHVLAMVGGLGTEAQLAVRGYLNQQKVPQIYVSTGSTQFGAEHKQFPWSIGWQPDYVQEGIAMGKYTRATNQNAKVAVLYQDDQYGKDWLAGYKKTAGRNIIATESYPVGSTAVSSQVARLRASGADTFLIIAIPGPAITALVTAYRIGWHPALLVNSVGAADVWMTAAQNSAGSADAVNRLVTTTYLKDPAQPKYQRDPQVRFYKALMAKYLPNANANNAQYYYGMAKAADFVRALYRAGKNPTRASLMRAVDNLTYKSPWVLSGANISTRPGSPFPMRYQKYARFNNGSYTEFGALQKIR